MNDKDLPEYDSEVLSRLGIDGARWASEFQKVASRLGYAKMDDGWILSWFCNAIMAGYDEARRRYDPILKSQLLALRDAELCDLPDAIDQVISDAIENDSIEIDDCGRGITWCKPALSDTVISSLAKCGYEIVHISGH